MTDLDAALRNVGAWRSRVEARLEQLGCFRAWAAACESGDTETSLLFRNRPDVERCRSIGTRGRIRLHDRPAVGGQTA